MRVIDCFPYFNEKELLELRINLLYDHVDKFIITDANKTHKGDPKPFTCKDTLRELGLLKDKVQVVEVDLPSYEEETDPWIRERLQRNAASQYFEEDDVCIISDCDEIMDPEFIQYYAISALKYPNNIIRIPLIFLMRRADLRVYDDDGEAVCFNVPFMCLKSHLEKYTLSEIRETHALNKFDIDFPDAFLVDNGKPQYAGWHFSWMGDNSRLRTKSNSFLHWNEFSFIENSESGDPFGRIHHTLKPHPLNLLPQKIFELENVKKFLFQSDYDEITSSKIYFRPYNGYGDWISVNGLVRFLSSKYDEVNLICDGIADIDFIKNLYRDDPNIKVIYNDQVGDVNPLYDYLNLEIWGQEKNDELKNYYDRFNQIGHKFNFEVLRVDDKCYDRLEFPHNFCEECKDVMEDNATSFYVAAGIPKEYRLENFYYERDNESENTFFEQLNLPENYIVVCEYGENLIDRKYIKNADIPIVNINNISEKYFDVIKIIENAKEVHLIENSIALLVYHLQYKNLMERIPINMHTYARKEKVRKCISRESSNLYLDMFLSTPLENWNFIYLEQFMEVPDVITEFTQKTEEDLSTLLLNYANNPENSENNFKLALYYDNIGQTASALSYYLRAAERTEDELTRYECLIRGSMCFDKQGTRGFTVKGMLQHAISIQPKRPEAYYLLSRFYERDEKDGHWIDSYMIASIGEKICDIECPNLRTDVDYPGMYGILYQKAVSSWWCGLCDESRDLFQKLYKEYELDEYHKKHVIDNLVRLNGFKQEERFPVYTNEKYSLLKNKFPGAETIERNFSESYQDMFVLTMLNGKRNGTYLEIGAGNSFYGNNTALLEKTFDWTGVAIDLCEEFVNAHNNERKNPCLLKNALSINYEALLSGMDFSETIDYLQLDCDPPEVTYKILLNIPFEKYKFAVVTYEHDYYCDETKSFQEKSRKYLESYGYVRVVNNISPDEFRSYEDWWVHPDLIDNEILNKMLFIDDTTKKAEDYILEKS